MLLVFLSLNMNNLFLFHFKGRMMVTVTLRMKVSNKQRH